MRRLLIAVTLFGALALTLREASAQRSAGTFDPDLTRVSGLQFATNPDAGPDCAAASGLVFTDAGLQVGIGTPIFCPTNSQQANRVAACQDIGIRIINKTAALADGGL